MLTVRVERMYSGVVSFALRVPPLFRPCTLLSLLSCLPGDTGREHGQPISVQKSVSVYQLSLETLLVSVEQVMLTMKTAPWIAQSSVYQQPSCCLSLNSRYSLENSAYG